MVRKSIVIISILAFSLFLASCSGGSGEADTTSPGAFFGGSEGIEVTFEPLSIMEEGMYTIYDTEDFPLEMIVSNKGEHSVESGDVRLELLGPAQADFSNIASWTKSNAETIEEISEFNPDGDEEVISFTPNSYATYNADIIGYQDITWFVDFDYDYKTYLIVNDICFKGDSSDDRVCEVSEGKTYSVSGAPISITSVEQDTGGKGIMLLKIGISNLGTGDATIVGEDFDDRFSQVAYTIEDSLEWNCKSGGRENEARMVDGTAEIICQLSEALNEDDLYTKSVSLTFDYTYRDIVSENLRVKESAE
ncbi:hypothetical protein HOA92_01900 [archaeon]|jgi:hypothetical protein|nr:hypothetical protein [archaeon]MBT6761767.1 hypothetical protein [archaeon]